MTKRALVIGGSGFVGGHLVPALLHDQFHVSVLNRGNKGKRCTKAPFPKSPDACRAV
ncbi:NAD-dependent epimerase/dehydratase family protein, partial [Mesorhizobium sp.]|uniref:NAD-dependent epimerase/dehydratase family protein n=1 Tax=Mesorhizobium sp. TaxID=1871066 RepID=UPI003416B2E8